jgi:DNA mismatch endonuclease (patch repair protein)
MGKRDPKITSKIMSAIKSKDTKPEMIIRKSLWSKGYRYRVHYKISGKPDIVFVGKKIAIFIDGDFWHGNNWKIRGLSSFEEELENYSDFWKEKILKNKARDKRVSEELQAKGWKVLRYWESDIKKDSEAIVDDIIEQLG